MLVLHPATWLKVIIIHTYIQLECLYLLCMKWRYLDIFLSYYHFELHHVSYCTNYDFNYFCNLLMFLCDMLWICLYLNWNWMWHSSILYLLCWGVSLSPELWSWILLNFVKSFFAYIEIITCFSKFIYVMDYIYWFVYTESLGWS